jgi:predicted 3-demethylubiquinone-9 3-methyltransferase (glyoxalase superfamily)
MARSVTPFLMFEGLAEEAMTLYTTAFPDARIVSLTRWGAGGPGREGTILGARMRILGQELMFFDSPGKHAFTFTPSVSFFVSCEDEAELDRLVALLGEGGRQLMPPGAYGFSRKFAWLDDRFGVSWQLDLPFPDDQA